MQHTLAVYDRALALEQAGGSAELAADLLSMLLQELPDTRHTLQTAFAAQDYDALLRHAHKLHGATVYTGVTALRAALANLELSLKRALLHQVPGQLETTLTEIDRVLGLDSPGSND